MGVSVFYSRFFVSAFLDCYMLDEKSPNCANQKSRNLQSKTAEFHKTALENLTFLWHNISVNQGKALLTWNT